MRLLLRLALLVFALAVALALPAGIASADDGAPTRACTSPRRGPSCTIMRPPQPQPLPLSAPAGARDCIVAVGGLGSDNDDFLPDRNGATHDTFEDLLRSFRSDPAFEIHRFGSAGEDPRFRYDTYGSIDAAGRALRDLVRSLSSRCHSFHIVAHSMGGAVADRAFSLGLSGADGVSTYNAISVPHNGAFLAQVLTDANDITDEGNWALRVFSQILRAAGIPAHDVTSDAVRDLAGMTLPRPARGVLELRQRLANDEIVLLTDNNDWRFESRDRLPDLRGFETVAAGAVSGDLGGAVAGGATFVANLVTQGLGAVRELEGHGGSLVNGAVRAAVETVIRDLRLPPDDRDPRERLLAFALSAGMLVLMFVIASKIAEALVKGILVGTVATLPVRAVLPGWAGWWERSWPSLVKKAAGLGIAGQAGSGIQIVKGIVTRLRNEVDRLAPDPGELENEDDSGAPRRTRRVDPRVAFVRTVLARAARALEQL